MNIFPMLFFTITSYIRLTKATEILLLVSAQSLAKISACKSFFKLPTFLNLKHNLVLLETFKIKTFDDVQLSCIQYAIQLYVLYFVFFLLHTELVTT